MARTPSVCLSVCLACSAIYPSPTYYPCMTEFARSRSPIHTLSEYCAADAITPAAATGAVNASPYRPSYASSSLLRRRRRRRARHDATPWAGSRETNLDVFPDSEIGDDGGGGGVNGLLPRTFGALAPLPSSLPSSRAPRTFGYRPQYTLQSPPRRGVPLRSQPTSPRLVLGIGPRNERTSERILQEVRYWPPPPPPLSLVLQKEIGRSSAKLCTETGDGQKRPRPDGCKS